MAVRFLRLPSAVLLLGLSLRSAAEPLRISTDGLQQKHWLGDAWGKTQDAAKNLRDKTSKAAQQAGQAVEQAKEKVGDATREAGRAALDAAIKASGRCGKVYDGRKSIRPHFSDLLAKGFQSYHRDPSKRPACMQSVQRTVIAELHRQWEDPTGLSDKITRGLSGEILRDVCDEPLLATLKAEEPDREDRPENYKATVRETLSKRVLTDEWIEGKIEAHCGKQEGLSRLFAVGAVLLPHEGLEAAPLLAVCSLGAAMLVVAAGARWRRRTTPAAE